MARREPPKSIVPRADSHHPYKIEFTFAGQRVQGWVDRETLKEISPPLRVSIGEEDG